MYAQLVQQPFEAPALFRKVQWSHLVCSLKQYLTSFTKAMPVPSSADYAAALLGMKLSCAFELLYQEVRASPLLVRCTDLYATKGKDGE
jgi:hypothetical protein